jgi:hypothetical protein
VKRLLTPAHLLLACVLAACLWLIHERISPYVGGSDSSGYYNNALLLDQGRIAADQRTLPGLPPSEIKNLYVPLGFVERPGESTMIPTYPIGISLFAVATAWLTGWDWVPGWTAGWNLLLGVILFYPLGRCFGLTKNWALLGTVILALSPLNLAMGLQYMSDVPALTWCEAAMLFALLSWRHPAWALAAGASFALAVLIRPTNGLLLAPLAIALGLNWKRWLCFGLGGLPGGIFFGLYNLHAYGGIFASGYGSLLPAFSWAYVIPSLKSYLLWIPLLFTPLTFLIFFVPFSWKESAQKTAILILWPLAFFALYAAYDCTHSAWWYLRFILPGVPPVIIGSLWVAQRACQKRGYTLFAPGSPGRLHAIAAAIVVACFTLQGVMLYRLKVLNVKKDDGSYYKSAEWLNQHAPGGTCVLTMQSSGSTFAYTPYTVLRWDVIDAKNQPRIAEAVAKNRRPLYAVLYPFEEQDAFTRYPGNWREVYQYRWVKVWLYEPPATPTS